MESKLIFLSLLVILTTFYYGNETYAFNEKTDELFLNWTKKYKITYPSNILDEKFKIWSHNKGLVDDHNQGKHNFQLELNHFADHNFSFGNLMKNKFLYQKKYQNPKTGFQSRPDLPYFVDWRKKGVVTLVKNQGSCGSCWTFSTTGSVESQHAIVTGKLVTLSESQLVDCDQTDHGCNGGIMDNAFQYVEKFGLEREKDYPYIASQQTCKYNKNESVVYIDSYQDVKGGEEALKEAVATVGPVSVAIDASQYQFQLYKQGVYYSSECSNTRLDHGVLVVGYGTDESNNDYWIVKNSWGPGWGLNGYILMSRNKDNNCGISTTPSYPIIK
jgi:cathepsin L